jgi:hypothetical protein
MFNIEKKLIKNHHILSHTFNNYFSKVVDESVIYIIKQDHSQINQHSNFLYQ